MNDNNIQQIFSHYTEKFEYVNNPEHNECYKWQVAKEFRMLMDRALAEPAESFAEALNAVNLATKNIINNYTQPFNGLVKMAQKEPETVQQMFRSLYSNDEGSLEKQEQLISDFFKKSYELLDKYYPGSYRFKQNSHSVSAYLFLYDPDRHYLFKASHAKEKQLYNEGQKKALKLLQTYNDVVDRQDKLRDILNQLMALLKQGTGIKHRKYGYGTVMKIDEDYITVCLDNDAEPVELGLPIILANKLIASDVEGFHEYLDDNAIFLKKEDSIKRGADYARNALKPYEMYLE